MQNSKSARSIEPLGRSLASAFGIGVLVLFQSGCALVSGITNPKVAWALNDPAPMSVVVRRADAAEKTANEVDRLLERTPVSGDAAWLASTAPTGDDAQAKMKSLSEHPLYRTSHARIVAAELWSDSLARLASSKPAAPTATEVTQVSSNRNKAAKQGKGTKQGTNSNDKARTADLATAADQTETSAAKRNSSTASPSSLLGAIAPELATTCESIMATRKELATLRERAAQIETAADEKGASAEQKANAKKEVAEIDKQIKKLNDSIDPQQKQLIAQAKVAASKAPSDVREHFGPVLVNLRKAVDDASISGGAAAVRYPLALPTMVASTQAMVSVIVADIVEEQTGHRPIMNGFQPNVSLEGGKVAVSLNGIGPDDLGKLSLDKLTLLTLDRTQAWVGHALGLLGSLDATHDTLNFEAQLLDALLTGMKSAGWTAPPDPTLPEAPRATAAR